MQETQPTYYWQQLTRPEEQVLPEPSVWVVGRNHEGDFNNGYSVAKALSPHRTRIIYSTSFKPGKKKDSIEVIFVDANTREKTVETVTRENFPNVLINSTSDEYTKRSPDPRFPRPTLDDTLTVQIIPPDWSPDSLAILDITPKVDMNIIFRHLAEALDKKIPNEYVYDTVPSRVNTQTLNEGIKAWETQLSHFTQNRPLYLAVIGERADCDEVKSTKDTELLAAKIVETAKRTGGSVIVTTAPRTKNAVHIFSAFAKELDGTDIPSYFYDYDHNQGRQNPYLGLLGLADKIVVTDDSMSMLSDAQEAGKAVYLYKRLPSDESQKHGPYKFGHKEYGESLLRKGLVLPIECLGDTQTRPSTAVNTAEQIANDIRVKLKQRQSVRKENTQVRDFLM